MKQIKPEIRILGIDDAPFEFSDTSTGLIGCLFRGDRQVEAVLRDDIAVDGTDATATISRMVTDSRQTEQIHVLMLDGITFGGFNIVDIQELHDETDKPVIAVSRRQPDREKLEEALENVDNSEQRLKLIEKAGNVYKKQLGQGTVYFQFTGTDRETADEMLDVSIRRGRLPEPIRVAHLIAAGIKTGESRGNA
jgi:endonuclease V-like protein UPF0215 family